jgi:hypothetical protein
MCMSCGCGQPNNDHGDSRNITQNDLNNAAQAAGISPNQAAQNIMNAQSGQGSGQSGSSSQQGSSSQYTGPGSVSGNAGQGPGFGPGISNQSGTSKQVAG